MKFGINTTLVVLEMVNFTRLRLVKFIPISNTTLVIFIPNFTATHAITSTNPRWDLNLKSRILPWNSKSFVKIGILRVIFEWCQTPRDQQALECKGSDECKQNSQSDAKGKENII